MNLKEFEAFDIPKLLEVDDDVEEFIIEDRSSWIQFLAQRVGEENSEVHVLGDFDEEGNVVGYLVVREDRTPPFCNQIVIWYAWSSLNHFETKKYFDTLKDWATAEGFDRITIYTNRLEIMEKFGFNQTGFFEMEVKL